MIIFSCISGEVPFIGVFLTNDRAYALFCEKSLLEVFIVVIKGKYQ